VRGRGRCLMTLALRGAFLRCLRITWPIRQCRFRRARLAACSFLFLSFGTLQTTGAAVAAAGAVAGAGGAVKVKTSDGPVALFPAAVVTVTSTGPGEAGG
jgi:hypothetical protein